jgi:hypothetical protein
MKDGMGMKISENRTPFILQGKVDLMDEGPRRKM